MPRRLWQDYEKPSVMKMAGWVKVYPFAGSGFRQWVKFIKGSLVEKLLMCGLLMIEYSTVVKSRGEYIEESRVAKSSREKSGVEWNGVECCSVG